MSLLTELATLPSGQTIGGGRVGWSTVTRHLREHYLFNDVEIKRKEKMRKRLAFYQDSADRYIRERIRKLFRHELTRELRLELEKLSHSNNVTKRIINLTSTVYSTPAKRIAPFDQDDFDEYGRTVRLHRKHRHAQRLYSLCNAISIYPMRTTLGKPRLRVVAPDAFSAVAHPLDTGTLLALAFDVDIQSTVLNRTRVPRWLVVDDTFSFFLDKDGLLIDASVEEHGAGRIPAVFAAKGDDDSQLLDSTTGDDIISAHEAITVLKVLALKNAKSGTKQPYAAGDNSRMVRGQAMDEESLIEVPEGVSVGTLDINAEPSKYLQLSHDISNEVFGNRGIPEPLRTANTRVSSGHHLSLLKAELADLRRDDLIDWREIEADRADLESRVFGLDLRDYRVDFAETTAPKSRADQLRDQKQERNEGRSNILDQIRVDNPDLTEEAALDFFRRNLAINSELIDEMRALNVPADASAADPGQSPEDNGRSGQPLEPDPNQESEPAAEAG